VRFTQTVDITLDFDARTGLKPGDYRLKITCIQLPGDAISSSSSSSGGGGGGGGGGRANVTLGATVSNITRMVSTKRNETKRALFFGTFSYRTCTRWRETRSFVKTGSGHNHEETFVTKMKIDDCDFM
jgi:hypothetical protein